MPVPLMEVARLAGVSRTSASMILNKRGSFSEAARLRVWEAAHALGYVPDAKARALRCGQGTVASLGSLIAYVDYLGAKEVFDPLGLSQFRLAFLSHGARQLGLYVVGAPYDDQKVFDCRPILDSQVGGAIAATPHPEVALAIAKRMPLVLLDATEEAIAVHSPSVGVDFQAGAELVVRRLFELGHRSVGYFRMERTTAHHTRQWPFFQDSLLKFGMRLHPAFDRVWPLSPANHAMVMRELADLTAELVRRKEITALLCPHNVYAIAQVPLLLERGVRVPEDLSLTGATEGVHAGLVDKPRLTSTRHPWEKILVIALETLAALRSGQTSGIGRTLIPPALVEGETAIQVGG